VWRYRKILYATAAALVGGVVGLETRAHRSPLSFGANADETWTYIHSPAAWGSHGVLDAISRSGWTAYAHDIRCDAKY
jgi:hypothetical protein